MNTALQRLIDLGNEKRYDEMSTAEFVIYTEWIIATREGKDVDVYLDQAAAEVADMQRLTEAVRAYLEHGFASDRRKMQDALRDYDYHTAIAELPESEE